MASARYWGRLKVEIIAVTLGWSPIGIRLPQIRIGRARARWLGTSPGEGRDPQDSLEGSLEPITAIQAPEKSLKAEGKAELGAKRTWSFN